MATTEIFTGPHSYHRTLVKRLAEAAGCTHEHDFRKLDKDGNVQKTKYVQVVTGDDAKVARVERAHEKANAAMEEAVRAVFSGPHMYTRPAFEARVGWVNAFQPEAYLS